MICGLLGRHLKHSYSPAIHKHFGSYEYTLFDIPANELGSFLKSDRFHGLNVTSPYKQAVIPYLDALSPLAQQLGAVNTVVRRTDGSLIGHNTDYSGFRSTLLRSDLQLKGKKVLILGNGGASKMGAAALESMGAHVVTISRSGENNYQNLLFHKDAAAIVNATPVGMYPDNYGRLLDLSGFPKLEGVFDMIYNPARTPLLLDAQSRGIPTFNGLWMLIAQAAETAQWFTGEKVPETAVSAIYEKLHKQMENIILIGMPGCGKSTVGKALAQSLGRPFVDLDGYVAEKAGMSAAEMICLHGEARFRTVETEAATEICTGSGLVIATGGGIVTVPQNAPLLRQNGRIFWLQRSLDKLPTKGRPLSSGNLEEMYQRRLPFYAAFADAVIDNNGNIENTVQTILEAYI